jgi:anhydro-N-acetylmuramic acid kinase
MRHWIGLMSGTSMDGVDGVLAVFDADGMQVKAHIHQPFTPALELELAALNTAGDNELHRACLATNGLMQIYRQVVQALLAHAGCLPLNVAAIAAHGQTVRHRPQEFDGTGYTVQLVNGALLAEWTGIDVICDFRSRDVAAGGQGAPLVPAFHAAWLKHDSAGDAAVVNIGGMANITLLPASGEAYGFDTGPGNALMDTWCKRHTGQAFDASGAMAASGAINTALLSAMLAEPFFARQAPKSTGRDLFNEAWLVHHLETAKAAGLEVPLADVQATLAELTAQSIASSVRTKLPNCKALWVCGGGAFNAHLMFRLKALMGTAAVRSTADMGIPPDQVEALAFAWLGQAHVERRPGNLISTTGAKGSRILGALYPA